MVAYSNPDEDVPSPIDLRTEVDARAWAESAEQLRPHRQQFRHQFAELVAQLPASARVLELGSGPGLLAAHVLEQCSNVSSYTLLDFSEPMLSMSRARLAHSASTHFVLGDFKDPTWHLQLSRPYSAVLAMQSVHEIRHKRHVPNLYRQVLSLLAPGGTILVCDHVPKDESLRATSLHLTAQEQLQALAAAGYVNTRIDTTFDNMVLAVGKAAA